MKASTCPSATAPDRAALVKVQEDFNEGTISFVFLMTLIAAVGYIVLAVGLARASIITKEAAALISIGGLTTLLAMAGPLMWLLVLAALVPAAGHVLAARTASFGPQNEGGMSHILHSGPT